MKQEQFDRVLELLDRIARALELDVAQRAHACYRCGRMTTLGTAWCQPCLDAAEEHRRVYPPRKKPPLPGSPRRPIVMSGQ